MALKSLSVLHIDAGSSSSGARRDKHRPDLKQIFNDVPFDPRLPSPAVRSDGPNQLGRHGNHDYEIALVPRRSSARRTEAVTPPFPMMDRVLLLPLTWRELIDRVGSELHQVNSPEALGITRFGEVCVNFWTMEISRSAKPVALTALQFRLLRFLIRRPQRVLSRRELLNEVWGYQDYPSTRTVDNHICMLRRKLEPAPSRPVHFLTVHGMGYKFVP